MKLIALVTLNGLAATVLFASLLESDASLEPQQKPKTAANTAKDGPAQKTATGGGADLPFDTGFRRPVGQSRMVVETVSQLAFRDITGRTYRLPELQKAGPIALVFLSTECPLAKRYTSRLIELHRRFGSRGVAMFGVYSNSNETHSGLKQFAKKAAFPFPVVRDTHAYLAKRLGAEMTPQAVLLDTGGRVRFRGGIDDNDYGHRARRHYLRDAIDAVLNWKPVKTPVPKTFGCTIHREDVGNIKTVTYTGHIARILQDNCQGCHRPGQVAPFSLTNFPEARRWAREIKAYTKARVMPPWKAAAGFGAFRNDSSLSEEEIRLIDRWVEGGMALGDKRDLPPSPVFPKSWTLGKPDVIIEMPTEYTIGPRGEDDYRHFVIPTKFGRDLYVEAIDVQPGNRKIVHHVLAYTDTSGTARKLDATDPGPGYTRFGDPGFQPASLIGGWAPGASPIRLPQGTGRWLPNGADVVLQVHYYRSGLKETDRTRVGLYLSRAKQPVRVRVDAAFPRKPKPNAFVIPAGERRYKITGSCEVKQDSYIFSVTPHMHLLGREMKVTVMHPKWKKQRPLVWITQWDFNWQLGYVLKQPLFVPKGARVEVQAWYDNSANNPHNPHSPPEAVRYGSKTTDEMCYAFFSYVMASKYRPHVPYRE